MKSASIRHAVRCLKRAAISSHHSSKQKASTSAGFCKGPCVWTTGKAERAQCVALPPEQVAYLLPFPADLILIAFKLHVGVHAATADQLEMGPPPIRLCVFQPIVHRKVLPGIPAGHAVQLPAKAMRQQKATVVCQMGPRHGILMTLGTFCRSWHDT